MSAMMNEFITLEKIMEGPRLTFTTNIASDVSGKYIPSFILLPLVQNCVIALHSDLRKEQYYIETEIHVENSMLFCNMNIQPVDTISIRNISTAIETIINRLETLYKNKHELKFSEEKGEFIITMSLLLLDNLQSNQIALTSETRYIPAHV